MAVGYLTFGTAAEGLILNNYSEQAREEKTYGGEESRKMPSLKLIAILHLKMDDWEMYFLLKSSLFEGHMLVFRVRKSNEDQYISSNRCL